MAKITRTDRRISTNYSPGRSTGIKEKKKRHKSDKDVLSIKLYFTLDRKVLKKISGERITGIINVS